jgi:hypothetical protein
VHVLQVRSSWSVMAPRPGPISTMVSSGCGAMAVGDVVQHDAVMQEVLAKAFAGNVFHILFL